MDKIEEIDKIVDEIGSSDTLYEFAESIYEDRQKISDLEAKLAESEKDRDVWKSMAKCGDKLTEKMRDEYQQLKQQLAQYEKFMKDNEWDSVEEMQETLNKCEERYFNLQVQLISKDEQCRECKHLNKKVELNIKKKLMAENSELQQQLAEKEKENLILFSMIYETLEKQGCENVTSQIDQMTGLILDKQADWFKGNKNCAELLKLLAEKEKELKYKTAECEKWKTDYKNCSELEKIRSREHQYCLDNWRASEQDKISFCIDKLEKVKDYNYTLRFGSSAINEFIDNQIKQLKEGK